MNISSEDVSSSVDIRRLDMVDTVETSRMNRRTTEGPYANLHYRYILNRVLTHNIYITNSFQWTGYHFVTIYSTVAQPPSYRLPPRTFHMRTSLQLFISSSTRPRPSNLAQKKHQHSTHVSARPAGVPCPLSDGWCSPSFQPIVYPLGILLSLRRIVREATSYPWTQLSAAWPEGKLAYLYQAPITTGIEFVLS